MTVSDMRVEQDRDQYRVFCDDLDSTGRPIALVPTGYGPDGRTVAAHVADAITLHERLRPGDRCVVGLAPTWGHGATAAVPPGTVVRVVRAHPAGDVLVELPGGAHTLVSPRHLTRLRDGYQDAGAAAAVNPGPADDEDAEIPEGMMLVDEAQWNADMAELAALRGGGHAVVTVQSAVVDESVVEKVGAALGRRLHWRGGYGV